MNMKSGLSQDYIDGLEKALVTAKAAFDNFAKAATKAKNEHDLAKLYYNDLKGYCVQVSATYVRISDLYDYLGTLVTQGTNISTNLSLSLESLTLIARFLKCLCEDTEGLRADVRSLIDAIEGIGSEVLASNGATLVKCIRDLEEEIKNTVTAIGAAIVAVIELYRCVLELNWLVGKNENGQLTGLVYDLEQMRKVLCCDYCAGINAQIPPCIADTMDKGAADELAECCKNPREVRACECDLDRPAVCDGGFQSQFFQATIKGTMDETKLLVEYKKCVWQFYDKKRAGALAKYDAIKKSYDAAKAAKALCK
ncbi:hypothetical protein GGR26_002584 [Lewinella marina]|nr:hypothetical protein [Neolewinella marina]NJB86807.1 hypothetical protein [Neolewinella marina]